MWENMIQVAMACIVSILPRGHWWVVLKLENATKGQLNEEGLLGFDQGAMWRIIDLVS